MGPKTNRTTYEFTEFSLVITLSYLATWASDTMSVHDRVNLVNFFKNGLSVLVCYNLYGFLPVEAMAPTLALARSL